MDTGLKVSLVIPVYNESNSITDLLSSIKTQTFQPDEIIIVDGGSTDNTIEIVQNFCNITPHLQLIKAGRAMPGKGRNIGTASAKNDWIAYTDAGIKLKEDWLEVLAKTAAEHPAADIIYGNYSPQINGFFAKCATIAYVSHHQHETIRGKAIISCLLKKEVWEKAGGFPDWRAAEDLFFMEKAEAAGANIVSAPGAMVKWELQPNLSKTFKKFDLYSKYNVWAGRQRYWHYGVARQYFVLLPFIAAGILHTWYWLLALPAWILARSAKRIWMHRHQFGVMTLFNPAVVLMVSLILLVIDTATYSGWIKALTTANPLKEDKNLESDKS